MTYDWSYARGVSVQHEPLDQTDLKDGVDATKEVVGKHMKEANRWVPQGPGGLLMGSAGPTWQWLGPRFGVESSRVF